MRALEAQERRPNGSIKEASEVTVLFESLEQEQHQCVSHTVLCLEPVRVRFFFNLVSYCDVRVQSKSLILKETGLY
jgi:hypothetical protein